MHFQGQQLISRETIFTGRTILTICVVRLIAWFIVYKPKEVDFLAIKGLEPQQADKAIMLFLIFLCVSHVVHWYGDYTGRWTWNSSKKYSNPAAMDKGPAEMVPIFEAETKEIKLFLDHVADTIERPKSFSEKTLKYRLEELENITKKISIDASKHNFTAKIEFYIWHLAIPLGASAFVIFKIAKSLNYI